MSLIFSSGTSGTPFHRILQATLTPALKEPNVFALAGRFLFLHPLLLFVRLVLGIIHPAQAVVNHLNGAGMQRVERLSAVSAVYT